MPGLGYLLVGELPQNLKKTSFSAHPGIKPDAMKYLPKFAYTLMFSLSLAGTGLAKINSTSTPTATFK